MDNQTVVKTIKDIWSDDYDIERKVLAIDQMSDDKSCIAKVTKAELVEAIKWMLETCIS